MDGFKLTWTDRQIDKVKKEFGPNISESLKSKLEQKKKQIKWKNNMSGLKQRFHKILTLNDLKVAEIRFSSISAEYRALCVVLPDEKAVFYHTTVSKKGSQQQRQLELMRENSKRIKNYFSEKY